MAQPTNERPAIASAVANPIAGPACCAPSAGVSSENRCATSPLGANNPKAIPAASVWNVLSRHSSDPGQGRAALETSGIGGAPGASPSGVNPICCGLLANTRSASSHMLSAMTALIAAAAVGNPSAAMAATQSGANTTPPTLPPL